ncbi:hypothetical protein DFP72DRAFT_848092 [Ephemerocybe angulata]|uniref:Uncharacterized protein n=1 Tax=Ephemerocybe angulata TaxID=980116 RepID=A0A8H6HWV6_9AGAR|nr:hypothetical protein DFP72DRAFT_848092 [Tulosesus angulatus]
MRPSKLRERVTNFLREIEARHMRFTFRPPMLLHYHSPRGELIEWAWYLLTRLMDSEGPSMLKCSSDYAQINSKIIAGHISSVLLHGEAYSETSISIVESLPSVHADPDRNMDIVNGEYVATCARNRCGYFERFFAVKESNVQIYPERGKQLLVDEINLRAHASSADHRSPEGVSRLAIINESSRREEGGLFQVVPDMGSTCPRIRERCLDAEEISVAVEQNASLQNDLMMGVNEERFWALFVQCHLCKTVMLRKPFATLHSCIQPHARRFSSQSAWRPAQGLPGRIPLPARRRTVFRVGAPTRLPQAVVEGTDTEIESANNADSDIPAAAPSSDGPTMLDILNDVMSNNVERS